MKQLTKKTVGIAALLPALAFAFVVVAAPVSLAASVTLTGGADAAQGSETPSSLTGSGGVFQTVSNVLLFIIGAVAVIMLIIGGLKYTTSGGDQNAVQSAKNTILYAIVGIVVAILAYAAVQFVVEQFSGAA